MRPWRETKATGLAVLVAGLIVVASASATSHQLRDPTRPLGYHNGGGASTQAISLQSILVAKGRRLAIINGETLKENDFIGDIQVIAIAHDRVTLSRGGRQWDLWLHDSTMRKNAVNRN